METGTLLIVLMLVLFILALAVEPIRKAIGIVLLVIGFLECLTIIGIIIGLVTIFLGALLLFI